jgi:hypothetical protein
MFVLQWLARKEVVRGEGGWKVGWEEWQHFEDWLAIGSDKGKWRKCGKASQVQKVDI